MFRVIICVFLFLSFTDAQAFNQNFNQAKAQLREYYKSNPLLRTFYCDCKIQWVGKKGIPQKELCGYEPRNISSRAERVEWEHIMPASWFGRDLQCWQKDKRQYCNKNDPKYRKMEGDMHNLFPVIGEINADRSNYRFGNVLISNGDYGKCDFKISFKGRKVEPRSEVKGDIARAMLYMSDRYNVKISKNQKRLYEVWSKNDPVSAEELKRNDYIKLVQGNGNPFVEGSYLDSIKSFFKYN